MYKTDNAISLPVTWNSKSASKQIHSSHNRMNEWNEQIITVPSQLVNVSNIADHNSYNDTPFVG